MLKKSQGLAVLLSMTIVGWPSAGADPKEGKSRQTLVESARSNAAVVWREPTDIGSRNLYYGPGGETHLPRSPFTFVEEDLNGTNPKYVVRDRDKVKWTVKLGMEARPETVATRLVWSVGYSADEDYFMQDLQVDGMPAHLKRGGKLVGPDGTMHAARLKRHIDDQKKVENWKWRGDPLSGTRELNGLLVMMALLNNWDLKNVNNEVYSKKDGSQFLEVSDLGASFGTTGISFPFGHSKGNLNSYEHSKFIDKTTEEYVDFRTPSRPSLIYVLNPPRFFARVRMDHLGHHIPRADASWIGHYLASLSPNQIQDAFRSAGYTPEQVATFTKVVQNRISELSRL